LRALRAVVRLQAIFRGRLVRKQAAVTLRCMQALLRVQAHVRARNVRNSPEGKAVQKLLDEYRNLADPSKEIEVNKLRQDYVTFSNHDSEMLTCSIFVVTVISKDGVIFLEPWMKLKQSYE